jgi:hypothetical protein
MALYVNCYSASVVNCNKAGAVTRDRRIVSGIQKILPHMTRYISSSLKCPLRFSALFAESNQARRSPTQTTF